MKNYYSPPPPHIPFILLEGNNKLWFGIGITISPPTFRGYKEEEDIDFFGYFSHTSFTPTSPRPCHHFFSLSIFLLLLIFHYTTLFLLSIPCCFSSWWAVERRRRLLLLGWELSGALGSGWSAAAAAAAFLSQIRKFWAVKPGESSGRDNKNKVMGKAIGNTLKGDAHVLFVWRFLFHSSRRRYDDDDFCNRLRQTASRRAVKMQWHPSRLSLFV